MKKKNEFEQQQEAVQVLENEEKDEIVKKETKTEKSDNFFKKAFGFDKISLSLAIISMFFSFFTAFLPLAGLSVQTLQASTAFFFLAFLTAFAAFVIEVVKMIKGDYKIGATFVVVVVALAVACLTMPTTFNLNTAY